MRDSDDIKSQQRAYWEADQSARRSPDHPAVAALFAPRARFLAGLVSDPRRASVLDLGSGNGFLSVPLQGLFGSTVALDLSQSMLLRNPCHRKVQASAVEVPFATSSFDVVVCSHLLHHMTSPDRERAVREMARVSRAVVVLYEPNRNNPAMFAFGLAKREERMSLAFSGTYLCGLLAEAGLVRPTARIEGTVLPNRTPAFLVPLARIASRTSLRAFGFYICGVGWKRHS